MMTIMIMMTILGSICCK